MTMQRLIIQMAQGVDHTGQDAPRAADRAAKRALSQANIPAPEALGISEEDVLVRLHVAVPDPSVLDAERLGGWNKLGRTEVVLVEGGLLVIDQDGGAAQIVATAAAEVFLPKQTEWSLSER